LAHWASRFAALQKISHFGLACGSATLALRLTPEGSTDVGLAALNLNVVAVCAVFVFVGAVLLGAF
jgi:hypothetical protein